MSRKPLSIWEQENKKEFDKKLKEYSTECLSQIYNIATKALDVRTRLQANEYIIDRCFGKNYISCKEEDISEQYNRYVTINLVPIGKEYEDNPEDEEQIWMVENKNVEDIEDDEWGTDVFIPKNKSTKTNLYKKDTKRC